MTNRERILAFVQGREHDRVPFAIYDGIVGPNEDVWAELGRENVGLLRWSAVHRFETPNCRSEFEETERGGLKGYRQTLHTPAGPLTQVKLYQPELGAQGTAEHFVKEPADYERLLAYLRDARVVSDIERYRRDDSAMGDDGLPHVALDRTPFQKLWVEWVSIQDLCLHMVDCPDVVEECISLMAGHMREQFRLVVEAAPPYVVFPDNITAPIIGERYFRKYCMPLYRELADMLPDDTPVFVHMDGDLKPLWAAIGESGVRGLDSMSPPPDNDTSVAQALAMWPEMRLMINFPSSVHIAAPKRIREVADGLLAEGGHSGRLQIQISENVPPGRWRTSFPPILAAIAEFGSTSI